MEQPQPCYRIYSSNRSQLDRHFRSKEQELMVYNSYVARYNKATVRAAVFNVHAFAEARNNPIEFIKCIRSINADILGIVEFSVFGDFRWFQNMGYNFSANNGSMMLFSRFPIISEEHANLSEGRYVLNAGLNVGGVIVNVYLTHFNYENHDKRVIDATILVNYHKKQHNTNVIVMGDLNHVDPTEADDEFRANYLKRTGTKYNGKPLDLLHKHFEDSFGALGWHPPCSTHWTGTRIDYIMYCKKSNILPVSSYIYHTTVSDHIPVIFDFI